MSLTKRTKDEENISPDFKALIPVCESPSKWHYCRPIYFSHCCNNLAHRVLNHHAHTSFITFIEHRSIKICLKLYEARTWHQRCRTRVRRGDVRGMLLPATSAASRRVMPRGFWLVLADSRRHGSDSGRFALNRAVWA